MAKYSIVSGWDPLDKTRWRVLEAATDEQLEKWSNDPNCKESSKAAVELAEREKRRAEQGAHTRVLNTLNEKLRLERTARREELEDFPFDPRLEVSADAKHIAGRVVTNLWVIFVLLPIVLGILFAILK
jgi:hypothetical protein